MKWCFPLLLALGQALIISAQNNRSYIVHLKPGISLEQSNLPVQGSKCISRTQNIYRVNCQLSNLVNCAQVLQFQPNRKLVRRAVPNDMLFSEQWALQQIAIEQLWDKTTGGITPCGDTIVVAIFDDDFDIEHEDLAANIWSNRDEIAGNGTDDDQNGYIDDFFGVNLDKGNDEHEILPDYHGSGVAGVIGATGNNSVGIAGVNWQVKLLFISSLDKDEALAIEAAEYLIALRRTYNETNGAKGAYIVAMNNSWGIDGIMEDSAVILCDVFNRLGEVGILSIGATANNQINTDAFGDIPSDCSSDHLIVVTNVDQDDELSVAGFGKENVDLGAPGEMIQSLDADNGYFAGHSGTSFAAPHVTGAIALLYALDEGPLCDISKINPSDAALRAKDYILDGARSVTSLANRTVTGGVLQLENVLDLVADVPQFDETVLSFQPNPTNGLLHVSWSVVGVRTLKVYDMRGKEILSKVVSSSESIIDTHNWPQGMYIIYASSDHRFWSAPVVVLR